MTIETETGIVVSDALARSGLAPRDGSIQHVNIGYGAVDPLAPNREICSICLGAIATPFGKWPNSQVEMLRGFLNHLEHVMNTPNAASHMRW